MDPLFRWIEASAFSVWLRESTSVFVYPGMLSAHALGMGFAVGVNLAAGLRALGVARGVPPRELARLSPLLWVGFAVNAASGVLLLLAYPTKALTNPLFYVKLVAVVAALWGYVALQRRLVAAPDAGAIPAGLRRGVAWVAAGSLVSWAVAIFAGRLLAYTYGRLLVDF